MKKFLPTSKGFTLIELMVVIAIIAILSMVGLGVFNGAQGSARDSRRLAEIDALSKNIESTRDPVSGIYIYNSTLMEKDYNTNGGLADPGSYIYCQAGSSTSTPPADAVYTAATWTSSACPTGYATIGGTGGTGSTTVNSVTGVTNDLTDASIKGWKVCAYFERSSKVFCKSNLFQ